jgi:uncharacterized membrane protein YhaH (DUF805 family)
VVATYAATWALARHGAISPGARAFVQVALLVPWFALDWKRFHDLGMPGRWAMVCPGLVVLARAWAWPPVESWVETRAGTAHETVGAAVAWAQLAVAAWLAYALACRQGDEGPNAYGPDPRGVASAEAQG